MTDVRAPRVHPRTGSGALQASAPVLASAAQHAQSPRSRGARGRGGRPGGSAAASRLGVLHYLRQTRGLCHA